MSWRLLWDRKNRPPERGPLGRDVRKYCRALLKHWLWWVGSSAIAIAFAWYQQGGGIVPTWALWTWALSGLAIAGFLAWRDQREKTKKARKEIKELQTRFAKEAPYFLSLTQGVKTHKLINKFEMSLGYINKGSRNALKVSASLWIRVIDLTSPATVVNHKSANEVPPGIELHLGATFSRTALVIKPQFVVLVVSYLKDRDQAVPSVDSFFYKWDGIKDEVMPIHVSHASMEQRNLIESDVMQDLERRGLLA